MSQPPPPPSFEAVLLHRSMTQRAVEDRFWSFDRALPPATTALILLCLAPMALLYAVERPWESGGLGGVLGYSPSAQALRGMGGRVTALVAQGQTWRLVSGIFLHGGLLHLLLNVLGVFGLGRLAEAIWGPGRTILLFTLGGLGGAVASQLAGVPRSVGASGAIFGLMGALWAFGLLQRASLPHTLGVILRRGVGGAILLNFALGITLWIIVDNFAHLGGLIAGIVIAPFLQSRTLPWERPNPTLGLIAGMTGALIIAWGLLGAVSRW